MPAGYQLEIDGPGLATTVPLRDGALSIGWGSDNGLCLPRAADVGERSCVFEDRAGALVVRGLDSRVPLLVNGARAFYSRLVVGDEVGVGPFRLVVRPLAEPAARPAWHEGLSSGASAEAPGPSDERGHATGALPTLEDYARHAPAEDPIPTPPPAQVEAPREAPRSAARSTSSSISWFKDPEAASESVSRPESRSRPPGPRALIPERPNWRAPEPSPEPAPSPPPASALEPAPRRTPGSSGPAAARPTSTERRAPGSSGPAPTRPTALRASPSRPAPRAPAPPREPEPQARLAPAPFVPREPEPGPARFAPEPPPRFAPSPIVAREPEPRFAPAPIPREPEPRFAPAPIAARELEPPRAPAWVPQPEPSAWPSAFPAWGQAADPRIIHELLASTRAHEASDLHLTPNLPPVVRLNGELARANPEPLDARTLEQIARSVTTDEQYAQFEKTGDLDFCYSVGSHRYRANLARHRSGIAANFRVVKERVPTLEELGIPKAASKLTTFAQGLVLVTGPLGAGKTTTMMALVQEVNETRPDHLITVEDPIEFLIPPVRCQVSQRELGVHTRSFESALRAALREDPDIIVIGDLRDYATARLAISAAETGHLVFASMPTMNAMKSIDKLIDMFPAGEQATVRTVVSESLRGVLSQRLVPGLSGRRVAAVELLLNSIGIGNMIREGKTASLKNAMQTGRSTGMRTLEMSLDELVAAGAISPAVAATARES